MPEPDTPQNQSAPQQEEQKPAQNAESKPEAQPGGQEPDGSGAEMPLPPANFEWLVYSLDLGARVALGILHFGDEKDKPKPDLRRAQHSIDMLAMVQEKTRGNLTLEEQRLIENSLTELRFRFVQVADELRKKS